MASTIARASVTIARGSPWNPRLKFHAPPGGNRPCASDPITVVLEPITQETCPHCPAAPGSRCEGQRVRRLCQLADPSAACFSPAYRDWLRRRADLGKPRGLPPSPGEMRGGGFPSNPPQAPAPLHSLAPSPAQLRASELVARLHAVRACPHRTERPDCGCAGLARCALGKGRQGLVNHQDCLACLHDLPVQPGPIATPFARHDDPSRLPATSEPTSRQDPMNRREASTFPATLATPSRLGHRP